MEKTNNIAIPQGIAMQTMKTKIRNAIAEVNLPAWVVYEALENILKDVKTQADITLRMEAEQYKKALDQAAEEESKGVEDADN